MIEFKLRKIEDNKVLIEEEKKEPKSYVKNLQQKNQIGEMI